MINVYKKFELTKNNHLRYWFNNNPNQHWRDDPLESAHMSVGSNPIPSNKTFMHCLMTTAISIKRQNNGDLFLFLSGGLDSEVAVRTFVYAGIKFRVVILKFVNDLNAEDVHHATELTNELGLNSIVETIDPIQFFESGEWINIAKKYQCYTFYQQMLMQAAEGLSSPMLTVDEIELVKLKDNSWGFIKKEDQDGCWHRFIEKTGIPAYNNFYTYDPDTISAFLTSPTVLKLINNEIFGKLSWSSSKHSIYSELLPWKMTNRPKMHGMEKLIDIWNYVENFIDTEMYNGHKIFQFPIEILHKKILLGKESICNTI